MTFRMLSMYKIQGGDVYNFEKMEIIGFRGSKNKNMEWIISRQTPDNPPPQQGNSDLISGLTGLCVYIFYPNLFPSQINIISPKKHFLLFNVLSH